MSALYRCSHILLASYTAAAVVRLGLYNVHPSRTLSCFLDRLLLPTVSDTFLSCRVLPRYYTVVKPGLVQPPRIVPETITKPNYITHGGGGLLSALRSRLSRGRSPQIEIKSGKQIEGMREACKLARRLLDMVGSKALVGVTTDELDRIAHEACLDNHAYPSPLHYKHFPKSICTSVNNVACHGIPDDRPLEDGDIVNIDITVSRDLYRGK